MLVCYRVDRFTGLHHFPVYLVGEAQLRFFFFFLNEISCRKFGRGVQLAGVQSADV